MPVFLTSRGESLSLAMSSRPSKPADDPISATGLDDRYAGSGEGGSSYMPARAGDDLLGCTRYVAAFSFNKAELCSKRTSNQKKRRFRKEPPLPPRSVGIFYAALPRHRPSQPIPKRALPRRARDTGSGTATPNFSPLDIGALAEVVVVANWSNVVQLAGTVQVIGISIKSKLSIVPTGPKAARNAASPDIAVVVPVPKNFGCGVLSWITVTCQVSVNVSPSGLL